MEKQVNIAVFTGDLCYSVRKCIVDIDKEIPAISWLILVHSPRKSVRQLLRNQWRNFRHNGWRWLPYQVSDIINRCLPSKVVDLAKGLPGEEYSLHALDAQPNVSIKYLANIHAERGLTSLEAHQADIGLSIAAPILMPSLFALPRLGTLNLHKGKVPDYRGMPPVFWELWHDEETVGCTVHRVDEKLDTGAVVDSDSVLRQPFSTLLSLRLALDEMGIDLMKKAVIASLAGLEKSQQQEGLGQTFRKPTLKQISTLNKKLALDVKEGNSLAHNAIKNLIFSVGLMHSRLGFRKIIEPRITVLLYHRVTDEVRDNLTVGVAQFERQMALVRKYCDVMSIEQVLESQHIVRSKRPLVAVSFDDGYLDNYTNAAPILMRHGIPASFFVTTGIINSNKQFPHDVRRGNPAIPMMNWDQLRTMRDSGFSIGSHTVNHIDCASEPVATVIEELAASHDKLKQELNIEQQIFAYPYGGQQHMTDERLALVKKQGYIGCLSAYGGSNLSTIDRYNVKRKGIHWEFSDRAFMFEYLGLR